MFKKKNGIQMNMHHLKLILVTYMTMQSNFKSLVPCTVSLSMEIVHVFQKKQKTSNPSKGGSNLHRAI